MKIVPAGLAVARVDQFALQERLREAAATEERIRLSRDLHDGLLQLFPTGVALQLQVSRRLIESDPQAAKDHLQEIQYCLIASEQRGSRGPSSNRARSLARPPGPRDGASTSGSKRSATESSASGACG